MALPSNVDHGTVVGFFEDTFGVPLDGTVTFTPAFTNARDTSTTPKTIILPRPVTATLSQGAFTALLVATDDPDLNLSPWTYTVSVKFSGAGAPSMASFAMAVPMNTTTDLADAAPMGVVNGVLITKGDKGDPGLVQSIVAGTNVTIDATDPANPVVSAAGGTGGTGSVTAANITDSTAVGRAVLTATDAPTARTAIGAGTSDLTIGTSSTTALAGDTALLAIGTTATTAMAGNKSAVDIGGATAAQGALAASALQPAALDPYALSADVLPNILAGTATSQTVVVANGAAAPAGLPDGTVITDETGGPRGVISGGVEALFATPATTTPTAAEVGAVPDQIDAYPISGVIVVANGAPLVTGSQYNGIPVFELDAVSPSYVRVHHCDGTVGASATAAGEGFDSLTGTAPTYVNAGFSGTALEWPGGSNSFMRDDLADQYVGMYVRIPALPATTASIAMGQSATTTAGAIVINTNGTVSIKDGLSTTAATSTTVLALNTWYRLEWNLGGTTQELRIFTNPASNTAAETLTGASAATITRWLFGSAWAASVGGPFDLDEITIADAWPAMGTVA